MTDLVLSDVSGNEIDPREMLTDQLICYVEGLNPDLGKPSDPYYEDLQSFLKEVSMSGVVQINASNLYSTLGLEDVDLSGGDADIKDINEKEYYVAYSDFEKQENELSNLMFMMMVFPYTKDENKKAVSDNYIFSNVQATPFGYVEIEE